MKKEIKLIEVKEKELQKALTELDRAVYYVEDMKKSNPELGYRFDNVLKMLICNVEHSIRQSMNVEKNNPFKQVLIQKDKLLNKIPFEIKRKEKLEA